MLWIALAFVMIPIAVFLFGFLMGIVHERDRLWKMRRANKEARNISENPHLAWDERQRDRLLVDKNPARALQLLTDMDYRPELWEPSNDDGTL